MPIGQDGYHTAMLCQNLDVFRQEHPRMIRSRYSYLLLIPAVLVVALLFSGCTGAPHSERTPPAPGNNTPGIPPSLPELTRPDDFPTALQSHAGSGSSETQGEMYENIREITDALAALSDAWDANGITCQGKSCTGQFINSAGDTVTIRSSLYDSVDAASAAYAAEKVKGSSYRQITIAVGEETYAWQHLAAAEAGFREKNLVVIIRYSAGVGMASGKEAAALAGMAAQNMGI